MSNNNVNDVGRTGRPELQQEALIAFKGQWLSVPETSNAQPLASPRKNS